MTTEITNAKEMMVALCEYYASVAGNENFSLIMSVTDDKGTCTTIKPNSVIEQNEPRHMEAALVILTGTFYKRYIVPDSNPSTFSIRTGETMPPDGTLN